MKLFSALLAASSIAFATARECALGDATPEQQAELKAVVEEGPVEDGFAIQARVVRTYAHVVTTSAKTGRYSQNQINQQIAVMNDAYAGMGISFTLVSTDFTTNNAWAAANIGTAAERNMKTALKKGTYGELDLYFTTDIPNRTLGWCYFPTSNPSSQQLILDGCVNLADSMPGGTATPTNLGATAIHEVGHWLGLFHVFQGQSCSGNGDQVADTPPQRDPSYGCPRGKDTCPGGGLDSIFNFMDYSDDACMDQFTPGQMTRATTLFDRLRAGR